MSLVKSGEIGFCGGLPETIGTLLRFNPRDYYGNGYRTSFFLCGETAS